MTVLNSTAVEVTWTLPNVGVNGIVRNLTIFYKKVNGNEKRIDISDNETEAYIIAGLQPSAQYIFSMLIKTVAEGPRGIHLTKRMPESSECFVVATSI